MDRTYEDAIRIIHSRRRAERPKTAASKIEPGPGVSTSIRSPSSPRGSPSVAGMAEWLATMGYPNVDDLNVLHVAGTKGKGSTCVFAHSFLRAHARRTGFPRRLGLYTSPHLIAPEERIRIDSRPLSRDAFARYFFEVYDRLPQLRRAYDAALPVVDRGPRHSQLYVLLALHVFAREGVDAVVVETHCGGEFDQTNVIRRPLIAAVTSLGMDHVEMLGPALENIAWHKAGIYKAGAVALSTEQDPVAAEVLERRAGEKGERLRFVADDPRLPLSSSQLVPAVQRKNASLALAAAEALLARIAPDSGAEMSQADIDAGVRDWTWPGRFQVVSDGRIDWHLDAAHNEMSLRVAAEWFAERSGAVAAPIRILIFSQLSESRDAADLLLGLARGLKAGGLDVQHLICSSYDAEEGVQGRHPPGEHALLHDAWKSVFHDSGARYEPTIQGALQQVMAIAEHTGATPERRVQVLITGSQHLVGPALQALRGAEYSGAV